MTNSLNSNKILNSNGWIYFGIIISIALRLLASQCGYNFDLTSWKLVGDAITQGDNIYVVSNVYPYGPLLTYIFGGLVLIQNLLGQPSIQFLHLEIAILLSIFDLFVYRSLSKEFGRISSLFFILNPISILISGYHSQIEIVAIALGLWAWENLKNKKYWTAGLLFGLSISSKHVLIFFPLILLFVESITLQNRIKMFILSYFVFFLSIGLYSMGAYEFGHAVKDIFSYAGAFGENGIIVKILNFVLPNSVLEKIFTISIYKYVFISSVLFISYLYIWVDFTKLFFVYLFLMFTFSSSIADQHMVLPLLLGVAYPKNIYFWIYTGLGSFYLLIMSNTNIAPFVWENILHKEFVNLHGGWFRLQFWLLLFLLQYQFGGLKTVFFERVSVFSTWIKNSFIILRRTA